MKKILFRLLKRLPGGSFKVVGYEKHEGGKIYHARNHKELKYDNIFTTGCYIPHDRKDMWTGLEIDGVNVFENDISGETFISERDGEITVVYKVYFCNYHLQWRLQGMNYPDYEGSIVGSSQNIRNIIGIKGVGG